MQRSRSLLSAFGPVPPLVVHERTVAPDARERDLRDGGQLVLPLVEQLADGSLPRALFDDGPLGAVWLVFVVFLCCPHLGFLLIIIEMKEVAGQHGPWCGIRIPLIY